MVFKYTEGYEKYAKFPMHYLRVTQSYDEGNHIPHWKGANYIDYPIDLGGMDGGRDYLYAPVDMKVVALRGIGSSTVSNKIFLESIDAVQTPAWGKTKIFMTAVHFEDSDVSKFGLKVGKIIRAGEVICLEGKETATANHLHVTCGVGTAATSIQNNKGKWVTKGNCKKPEEIFYIDTNFTKVLNMKNLKFKNLPELITNKKIGIPVSRDLNSDQIEVLIDNLKIRDEASTSGKVLGYINRGIYNYVEIKQNDNYTWYNVTYGWIAFNDKWSRLYSKEEIPLMPNEDEGEIVVNEPYEDEKGELPVTEKSNIFISLFKKIYNFSRKIFKF